MLKAFVCAFGLLCVQYTLIHEIVVHQIFSWRWRTLADIRNWRQGHSTWKKLVSTVFRRNRVEFVWNVSDTLLERISLDIEDVFWRNVDVLYIRRFNGIELWCDPKWAVNCWNSFRNELSYRPWMACLVCHILWNTSFSSFSCHSVFLIEVKVEW